MVVNSITRSSFVIFYNYIKMFVSFWIKAKRQNRFFDFFKVDFISA